MRVIVTGPTGAVGIALIQRCILEGAEVYAVCRPNSKRLNRIPQDPLVHVIECGLDELKSCGNGIIPDCDVFFHLGWEATAGKERNHMKLQLGNVGHTLDAVELADTLNCRTFVGAGSQAEYGRHEEKINAHSAVSPENGYGMAKLCAGQMSRFECNKRGINHIWARIFSVYGPFDQNNSMIISTIQKMLSGEKPLLTKGEQRWDYLYCTDAARALFLLGERGRNNEIYCVGSGKTKQLTEYIDMIKTEMNSQTAPGIGEIPYGANQIMYLCADIGKLTQDTGFLPEIEFQEGIRETVRWVKEWLVRI